MLGVVYAPAMAWLFGGDAAGALELHWPSAEEPGRGVDLSGATPIAARPAGAHRSRCGAARTTPTGPPNTANLYDIDAVRTLGSSLKFCLIAAAEADLYPRHGTTMEWDTAAGQAVLKPPAARCAGAFRASRCSATEAGRLPQPLV